jgi:hypothetical protein
VEGPYNLVFAAGAGALATLYADVVCDGTATGSNACADQGTGSAAEKAAYDCSADGRADDDLGTGVVAVVTCALRGDGAAMALGVALRQAGEGHQHHAGKSERGSGAGQSLDKSHSGRSPGKKWYKPLDAKMCKPWKIIVLLGSTCMGEVTSVA